jgi:hypothetical protein
MNQIYSDFKKLIKTHWETILLILLISVIFISSNYTDIKAGIIDAWLGK